MFLPLQLMSYHVTHLSVREFVRRVVPAIREATPNAVFSENPAQRLGTNQYLVLVDPVRSTLTLSKPSEEGRRLLQMAELYDVTPPEVKVSFRYRDLYEGTEFTATANVVSHCSSTFTDFRSGASISVSPNINYNGSVTYTVAIEDRNGTKAKVSFRLVPQLTFYVRQTGWLTARDDAEAGRMFKSGTPFGQFRTDSEMIPFELKLSGVIVKMSQ